ncbi:hypothetical protein SH501x_002087 [Pirellulaceae bacterium SH501]
MQPNGDCCFHVGDLVSLKIGSAAMIIYEVAPEDVLPDGMLKDSCRSVSVWQSFGHPLTLDPRVLRVIEPGVNYAQQLFEVGDIVQLRIEKVQAVITEVPEYGNGFVHCAFELEEDRRVRHLKVPSVALRNMSVRAATNSGDFFEEFVSANSSPERTLPNGNS